MSFTLSGRQSGAGERKVSGPRASGLDVPYLQRENTSVSRITKPWELRAGLVNPNTLRPRHCLPGREFFEAA